MREAGDSPQATGEGIKAGRPLLFADVEELQNRIEAYFIECDREEDTRIYEHESADVEEYTDVDEKQNIVVLRRKIVCPRCRQNPNTTRGCTLVSGELKRKTPYTTTGLALWLGTSRQTLLNYEVRPEFFDTIKQAKLRVENYAEQCLFDKDVPTHGVKFSLSNNHDGWKDKSETDLTVKQDPAAKLLGTLLGDAPDAES